MSDYHFEIPDEHYWPEDIWANTQTLIEKAKSGTLTEAEFLELAELEASPFGGSRPKSFTPPYFDRIIFFDTMRSKFRLHVAFAIYTVEYLDSLARLLAGLRVHEVCARNGILQPLMTARGIDWTCSDIDPQADHVEAMDALEAVKRNRPDVVFASWIDWGLDLDQRLATLVPCVFVVEPCAGTTHEGFLDPDSKPYEVTDIRDIGWFRDVPNWNHVRDFTVRTIPRRGSNPLNFA